MQVSELSERIKVGAVFDGSRVAPKWFYWGRRKHVVQKVDHVWRSREGETTLLHFSLTDGSNVFEIRLDQKTLEWRLLKVYQEG